MSDYGRGVAADPVVRAALARAAARRVPVVWDPHPRGAPPVAGATVVTPNLAEARGAAGVDVPGSGVNAALALGADLVARWDVRAVAVTLGGRGAVVRHRHGACAAAPRTRRGRDRPVRRRRPLRRRGRRPARRRRDRRRGGGRCGRRRRRVRGARRGSGGPAGRRRLVPARYCAASPAGSPAGAGHRPRRGLRPGRAGSCGGRDGGGDRRGVRPAAPRPRREPRRRPRSRRLPARARELRRVGPAAHRRGGASGGPGRGAGPAGGCRRGRPVRGRRPACRPRRPAPRPVGEGRRPRPGRPPRDAAGALVGRRGRRRPLPADPGRSGPDGAATGACTPRG